MCNSFFAVFLSLYKYNVIYGMLHPLYVDLVLRRYGRWGFFRFLLRVGLGYLFSIFLGLY